MQVDLHIHTTYSDGIDSPEKIVSWLNPLAWAPLLSQTTIPWTELFLL